MPTLIQLHRIEEGSVMPQHYAELEVTAIPRKDETVKVDYTCYTVLDVIHDYDTDDIVVLMERA